MHKAVKLVVNFSLIAVVAAALGVGNHFLNRYSVEIASKLTPPITNTKSQEVSSKTGQELSGRIQQEGTVLLKNDGVLPLSYSATKNVNVFGWRSVDWIYGSEGQNASGCVSPEDGDIEKNVDLLKALNKYGIQYNKKLTSMYESYSAPIKQSAHVTGTHINNLTPLREPKITDATYYTPELLDYSKEFSDTALVVIGRMAGEGMNCSRTQQVKSGPGALTDPSRHYLELSTEEEALLQYCGANYDKVIVLLNMANPFELGFLNTIDGIDACLYLGFTGTRGMATLPSLLYGEVSPSGHTVDTFPYDMYSSPASAFTTGWTFTNVPRDYTDFVEGIYVGYKWYETADAEGVFSDVDNEYGKGYNGVVQFPFGFGLSYNTYRWTVGDMTQGDKVLSETSGFAYDQAIQIPVTVTNDGQYPGRDVVEVYVTAPYYGHTAESAIEKASVSLVGYAKTNVLRPGESETVTVEIDPYDFASYDDYDRNGNGFKGYELEAGDYVFSVRTSAHEVKKVTVDGEEKEARYTVHLPTGYTIENDPVTGKKVSNKFTGEDSVDPVPLDGSGEGADTVPWLNRSHFPKPSEFADLNVRRAASKATVDLGNSYYTLQEAQDWDKAEGKDEFGNAIPTEKPVWGKSNGLKLAENGTLTDLGKALGEDYDSSQWADVLDEVPFDDAVSLMSGYYGSKALDSVGKPFLADYDGPAQINGFVGGPGRRGTGYPTSVVLGATWNPKLAYEFGKSFGDDMKSLSINGLWGWALDTHRTPWFGRNHESPSEDTFLTGNVVMNAVKGLSTRGRYCFLKHFSVYSEGGTNRRMTEQTLRETYLRAFRMGFVKGGALGCMTTYTGLGAEHSETTLGLLQGVLRNEWDFKGAITTDYIGNNLYMESLLRCGGNFGMGVRLNVSGISYSESSTSARLQQRMRESVHQILYMWLRADYRERQYLANPDSNDTYISSSSISSWDFITPTVLGINISVSLLLVMWAFLTLLSAFGPQKARLLEDTAHEDKEQKEDVVMGDPDFGPDAVKRSK